MDTQEIVFFDGFEKFPTGDFPYDYSPLGEYHCVEPEGHRGNWLELTIHHSWRKSPGWLIGEENDNQFMEHAAVRKGEPSILASGDFNWQTYRLQVKMCLLSEQGFAGIAARLQNSRSYYLFCMDDAKMLRLSKVYFEETTNLGEHQLPEDFATEEWHYLAIEVEENRIKASLDREVFFDVVDEQFGWGEIALVATAPVRFDYALVTAPGDEIDRLSNKKISIKKELSAIRETYPKPVLWRRFSLGDSGAGKSVRFGDLDGDGEIEVLMAQNLKRLDSGNFSMISCLTAFKLDGEVLWQIGEPNSAHALLTSDIPLQIHDIDGDGKNEVVMCKDFKLQIRDGATGELKMEAPNPKSLPSHQWLKEDIFFRIFGDSLCFADLTGRGQRREILIKDRYNHIWAYSDKLEPLWSYACETGHYPFPYDANGDGRDEVFVGSTLLDAEGERIWSIEPDDHVDTIAVTPLTEGSDPIVLLASGDAGLYALDLDGKVIFHERLGHMQELTVAKFRDDVEGLQFFTKTFWGYPGIVFLYDANLKRLLTIQGYPHGFSTFPVNWSGDGKELIFASPHPRLGGLYDGWGRRVILMPEDGHPNLCYHPLNVMGDVRDELLCWDEREMWIYTQSEPFKDDRIYAPKRMPLYNFSNYRSEISIPAWI